MISGLNKVVHFSRLIKIENRLREFNYKKNNLLGDNVYDVDTADDRGNRIYFKLRNAENIWTVEAKTALPDWLKNNEKTIVTGLEEGYAEFIA